MDFIIDNQANNSGTCYQGRLVGNYQKIIERFGKPVESDGYKVSGEWIFKSENGDIVTLYDWKSTKLYDEELPLVEEFKHFPQCVFNIGAHNRSAANAFSNWFIRQFTSTVEE